MVKERLQRGQALPFHPRTPILTRLARRGWLIAASIQTQAGDEGNWLLQGLTEMEQIQDGVAAVSHQHQGAVG